MNDRIRAATFTKEFDEYKRQKLTQQEFDELEKLWNEFEDVPIDNDECIDEDFFN